MMPLADPVGSLVVERAKGASAGLFYAAKWRASSDGRQVKRRLGPAWLELDEAGRPAPRRGRVKNGWLDERRAHALDGGGDRQMRGRRPPPCGARSRARARWADIRRPGGGLAARRRARAAPEAIHDAGPPQRPRPARHDEAPRWRRPQRRGS